MKRLMSSRLMMDVVIATGLCAAFFVLRQPRTSDHELEFLPRQELVVSGCAVEDPAIKQQVEDAWRRIEAAFNKIGPKSLENLNPPATREEIAGLERELGFPLPYDLKCSLLIHNGHHDMNKHDSCLFISLLSLNHIRECYFWLLQFYAAEIGYQGALSGLENLVHQPDAIGVAHTEETDFFIELANGRLWILEYSGFTREMAPSFADWLTIQAELVERGKLEDAGDGKFYTDWFFD